MKNSNKENSSGVQEQSWNINIFLVLIAGIFIRYSARHSNIIMQLISLAVFVGCLIFIIKNGEKMKFRKVFAALYVLISCFEVYLILHILNII